MHQWPGRTDELHDQGSDSETIPPKAKTENLDITIQNEEPDPNRALSPLRLLIRPLAKD